MTDASDEAGTAPAEAESDGQDADRKTGSGSKEPRKPLLRRPVFWVVLVLVLLGICAAGLYWWFRVRPFATTDDAFIGADIVYVAPQVAGTVAEAPVEANAHVEAGRLLVRIDPNTVQAKLDARQAALDQAQAQAAAAEVGVQRAEDQIAEAESKLRALEAEARNAQDTLRRDQDLFDRDARAIPEKTVVNARNAASAAEAQAEAAARAVNTAKTAKKAAEAEVTSAQAAVEAARAAVASARIDLGHTEVVAPVAGQIVQKTVNTGSYVTVGTAMMALVPDDLYVTANFKETQLAEIRIGQPVDIEVDAFPDASFHGKVVSIQNGAGQAFQLLPPQNATGNYVKVVQRVPVRISIDGADLAKYPLGPGMSVVPSIRIR